MPESLELNFDNLERRPLHEFSERAYLNYSMYVILERALPHIGEGLKPVQRTAFTLTANLCVGRNSLSVLRAYDRFFSDVTHIPATHTI